MWFTRWFSSSLWLAVAGIGTFAMWNVNADTMAANWWKAQKFIEPLGNLLLDERRELETNLHRSEFNKSIYDPFMATHRVLQSSRAFKANLTMSTNTGNTTHSSFGLWCCNLVIDGVFWLLWVGVVAVAPSERIWICFRSLIELLLSPLLAVSVCLLHKFRSCECSMCFNKQSSCCWFVNGTKRFHCKGHQEEILCENHLRFISAGGA